MSEVSDNSTDQTRDDEVASSKRSDKVSRITPRLVALLVFLVIVSCGASWWVLWGEEHFFPHDNTQAPVNKKIVKQAEKTEELKQTDPQWLLFSEPKTGEKWLAERKKVANQGWLKDEAESAYYEVGSRADNTIYAVYSSYGFAGGWFLFEKANNETVNWVLHPQTTADYKDQKPTELKNELFNDKVGLDYQTRYDSLSVPNYIVIPGEEKVEKPQWLGLRSPATLSASGGAVKTLVLETKTSKLYRVEKKYEDTGLTAIAYEMTLPIGTSLMMHYAPNKLNLEGYTWNNDASSTYTDEMGKMVYDDLKSIASGCGGLSVSATRTDLLKLSDLKVIGKTNTGRAVYELRDTSNQLFTKAYSEYTDFSKTGNLTAVSKEEFIRQHGLVLIENGTKELLVYARGKYAPRYGCAKPVVYLYPEKTTTVNVRVGADVKVSDPLYPQDGWTVQAQPDGQLTYEGRRYDSLFWEGPGIGSYPAIKSGTVVTRDKAEATMRIQLRQQGLNTKETTDFMEFWKSRIPNKPFVRLTWFTTAQMDALAPLRVTPKPQTVQRVFLDMAGYDKRPTITPQKLHSFSRTGFTVVEWGGLAYMP